MDIFPTVVRLAGAPLPEDRYCDPRTLTVVLLRCPIELGLMSRQDSRPLQWACCLCPVMGCTAGPPDVAQPLSLPWSQQVVSSQLRGACTAQGCLPVPTFPGHSRAAGATGEMPSDHPGTSLTFALGPGQQGSPDTGSGGAPARLSTWGAFLFGRPAPRPHNLAALCMPCVGLTHGNVFNCRKASLVTWGFSLLREGPARSLLRRFPFRILFTLKKVDFESRTVNTRKGT